MIILMDTNALWYIVVAAVGLVFGSFAGASVWRLRARQLIEDKKLGEEYDKKEYKRLVGLTKSSVTSDRSRCLECGHELRWYDLIPLVSWLSTKGRCRYCHQPIGFFEPSVELVTSALFVAAYHQIAMTGGNFGGLLLLFAVIVGLVILFFYDLKWLLLPNIVMWSVIGLSAIWWGFSATAALDLVSFVISTVGALMILSGLYLVLWLVSRGRWVGFGDVKLGLALGLLLGDWRLALLTLFLANLIGTLIVLPGLLSKKLTRRSQVPFGPLLITGFFIAFFLGDYIIKWYLDLASLMLL